MHPFAYVRPETVADAVAVLEEHGPEARLLAGGTDLLVQLRNGKTTTDVVVDMKRIVELAPTIAEANGALRISATAVLTDMIADERVRSDFPALVEAASVVGSVQIRNRATLVGNICNASPAADTPPALLVYGAQVELMSRSGARLVPLEEFFVGPGETVLQRGELVTAILLPRPTRPMGAAFGRMTRRRGVDLASINLCCLVDDAGTTTFAFGAVGPKPFVAVDESGVLANRSAPPEERMAVMQELTAGASPISDVRASAEYRRAMLLVVGKRALEASLDRLAAA